MATRTLGSTPSVGCLMLPPQRASVIAYDVVWCVYVCVIVRSCLPASAPSLSRCFPAYPSLPLSRPLAAGHISSSIALPAPRGVPARRPLMRVWVQA